MNEATASAMATGMEDRFRHIFTPRVDQNTHPSGMVKDQTEPATYDGIGRFAKAFFIFAETTCDWKEISHDHGPSPDAARQESGFPGCGKPVFRPMMSVERRLIEI